MDDQADDEGPRQEPISTELEAARAYTATRQYETLEALMSQDAPDVDAVLAQLLQRPAWHRQAACNGMGTENFIIDRGDQDRYVQARELCEGCPVRQECLDFALADPEVIGLWGGTTKRQRRVLRRGAA